MYTRPAEYKSFSQVRGCWSTLIPQRKLPSRVMPLLMESEYSVITLAGRCTAPQHLVCRAVPSLHINHMQMSIIEVFICRRLHMNTSMILICIWLICRLGTALHTKCCGAVMGQTDNSVCITVFGTCREELFTNRKGRFGSSMGC